MVSGQALLLLLSLLVRVCLLQGERIAICSIEKANMAINHLIQEKRLHELVSVVVDEAHMLADPNRCTSSCSSSSACGWQLPQQHEVRAVAGLPTGYERATSTAWSGMAWACTGKHLPMAS